MKFNGFFCGIFLFLFLSFSCFLLKQCYGSVYDGSTYNVYRTNNTIFKNGDNAIGSVAFVGGATVPVGTGVRLNIDVPLYNYLDLRLTGSLELTGNLILDSNISLSSGGIIGLGNRSLILNGNLRIPDNAVLEFASSGIIDAQGHDVILGKYAQLLVDGGVTVTFKNMTIKNTLSTISCPPVRCMDWYSKACFDNVIFAFNDDFAFRNGQFFIHNEVEFTGTSKFSYRSVRPSYIAQHSNLIFDPQTTFEYYPSSTDNTLIQMADKTSAIMFDGSTLLGTHTGIRLTKGNLYIDNKVTLSNNDKTVFTGLINLGIGLDFGTNARSADWSPDGKYFAIGGINGITDLIIYGWNGISLTAITSLDFGNAAYTVKWSPDGKYLAVGGDNGSTDLVVYRWNGSALTAVQSISFGTYAVSISWSNNKKYLAVGGSYLTNDLVIYGWSGETLTVTTSKSFGTTAYAVGWSPDDKYLAVGGYTPGQLVIYEWNGSTLTSKDTKSFTDRVLGVSWNPTGKYLAIGGGNSASTTQGFLVAYEWNGSLLTARDTESFGQYARGIGWSPDGKYLAVGGVNLSNDFIMYEWNGVSLTVTASKSFGDYVYSVNWTPDSNYLSVVGQNGSYDVVVYGVGYKFETSPQGFSNSIIFGNSEIGSSQDLDVYLLGAARVGIYGKVLQDSVNSSWNFQSRDSYVSLDRYDSQFKITNADSVKNWKKNQIIKSSQENTLFLQDNQIWGTNLNQITPEETFEFMDNFVIPDGQLTQFSVNAVIDGQGHDLILGKYSQLLVDGGVTVTFKNMTIRNTLNTISCPPIRCMDWYSQACFDNVTFAFNDDWAFRNGQFFIQNDVNFTGTSKLSYRSVRPSYITSHSNLIFNAQTTFEYYPSSTDNSLIRMADKTSAIMFDGSTLQTTHTGIRLTAGSLYFDNKVTLSSASVTALTSNVSRIYNLNHGVRESYTCALRPMMQQVAFGYGSSEGVHVIDYRTGAQIASVAVGSGIVIYSMAWDPSARYLVSGCSTGLLLIDEFDLNSYKNRVFRCDLGSAINAVDWSSDGENIIWGDSDGYIRIAPISNLKQNPATPSYIFNQDMGAGVNAVAWNSDGEYIAWGDSDGFLQVYKYSNILMNPVSPTYTFSQDVGNSFNTTALKWSPDGKYLAWVDSSGYLSIVTLDELKNNRTTPSYIFKQQIANGKVVAWSSNGAYIAVGTSYLGSVSGDLIIYAFEYLKGNPGSPTPIVIQTFGYASGNALSINSLVWSLDGNYIFLVGGYAGNVDQQSTYVLTYRFDTAPQGYSNGIIFGNSALGQAYDANIYILGGANAIVDGKIWYDDVN